MGSAACSYALDRAVAKRFQGLGGVTTYCGDILLYSTTFEKHVKTLGDVLDRIIDNGFLLNPTKTRFATPELDFLGFTISAGEVSPDMKRTKELEDLPPPASVPDVRRCLGIFGYFRDLILSYSRMSNKLSRLLRKNSQ